MQFSKKVWKEHEKALAGTFLPPGSGLATPAVEARPTQDQGKVTGNHSNNNA